VNAVLLAAVPSQPSGLWLRVTMDLFPSSDGTQAPTLLNWRQSYDCKPSE
jgi:hypothetical protein